MPTDSPAPAADHELADRGDEERADGAGSGDEAEREAAAGGRHHLRGDLRRHPDGRAGVRDAHHQAGAEQLMTLQGKLAGLLRRYH